MKRERLQPPTPISELEEQQWRIHYRALKSGIAIPINDWEAFYLFICWSEDGIPQRAQTTPLVHSSKPSASHSYLTQRLAEATTTTPLVHSSEPGPSHSQLT